MKKIFYIDLARSLSVLYIVGLLHLLNYTNAFYLPQEDVITKSFLGLFVLMSAILVTKTPVDRFNMKSFFVKRLLRIFPLFALALPFFVVVGQSTPVNSLLALVGATCFFPPQIQTMWFISMLIVFYILTPILYQKNKIYSILLFAICCAFFFVIDGLDKRLLYYFPCYFVGLLFGIHRIDRFVVAKYTPFFLLSIGIVAYYFAFEHESKTDAAVVAYTLTSSFLLLSLCSYLSKFIKRGGAERFIGLLAYSSFAAYLFHRHIFFLFTYLFRIPEGYPKLFFLVLIVLPIIFFVAYWIQYVYDLVLDKISKRTK